MDSQDTTLSPAPPDSNGNLFDEFESAFEHDMQSIANAVSSGFESVAHDLFPTPADLAVPHIDLPQSDLTFVNLPMPDDHPIATTPTDDTIVGDPLDDLAYWHLQTADDTCAICSQQFVIEQLTGQPVSEDQLVALAEAHGWYKPGGGTSIDDVGNLLQLYGLHFEKHDNETLDDIEAQLKAGHGVIVGVRDEILWGTDANPAASIATSPTIPGQGADHAVEVIGVDRSDPNNPQVILNDSGTPNGRGELVPLATFMQAWAPSGNMMVEAW
jgi:hypothetical protein